MVVDYCLDGEWVKNVPGTQGNEFVLAVFIPCSRTTFLWTSDLVPDIWGGVALGQYIRDCEPADHASWTDKSEMTIIAKMKSGCATQLCHYFKPKKNIDLSGEMGRNAKKLGKLLLRSLEDRPGDGKDLKNGTKKNTKDGNGSAKKNSLKSELSFIPPFTSNQERQITMPFRLEVRAKSRTLRITAYLNSSVEVIDAAQWEKNRTLYIGEFPIAFTGLYIDSVGDKDGSFRKLGNDVMRENRQSVQLPERNTELAVEYRGSLRNSQIVLQKDEGELVIEGDLSVAVTDPTYRFQIKISEEE